MVYQIKLFERNCETLDEFEDRINEWLNEEGDEITCKEVKYSYIGEDETFDSRCSVAIIYE